MAELVRSPQPRFEIIKAHYPQVFYAWSSTSDCVLEVERTGQWRAAFEALRAQGGWVGGWAWMGGWTRVGGWAWMGGRVGG